MDSARAQVESLAAGRIDAAVGALTMTPEHEALMDGGGRPSPFPLWSIPPATVLRPGVNTLAIQVHNVSIDSDDMTLIPFLTLGMDAPPPEPNGVPDFLQLFIRNLHTNFKLTSSGETLTLTAPGGALLDRVATGRGMDLDAVDAFAE